MRIEASPNTGTITRVTSAAADTLILANNDMRQGAAIFNESTAVLYLVLSKSTASLTNYTAQVPANNVFILDDGDYTGEIRGIWFAANGAAQVTEFV